MPDDSTLHVVYMRMDESGQEIPMQKPVPMNSPLLRPPADDGPWLNFYVKVLNRPTGSWCMGMITQILNGVATVRYREDQMPPPNFLDYKQMQHIFAPGE